MVEITEFATRPATFRVVVRPGTSAGSRGLPHHRLTAGARLAASDRVIFGTPPLGVSIGLEREGEVCVRVEARAHG